MKGERREASESLHYHGRNSESHQYTGLDKLPLMADSASLQSVEESCL